MAYFPLFVELDGADCLVVGGGAVALRKVQKLLPYGPRITVVAPEFLPEFGALPAGRVARVRRDFCPGDEAGRTLVIAASGDRALNRQVSELCRAANLPVNAVDDPDACTFLFPALVRRGPLSIGISTGGASPTAAVYVKQTVEAALPPEESFAAILSYLAAQRAPVRAAVADESRRADVFAALFRACMACARPLTEAETRALVRCPLPAGRVDLVGAGCGAADLITLRGVRLLRACDAVVYDDLVAPALLEEAPHAERWPVGKRGGGHSTPQQDINGLLIRLARAGKTVVRLKGGDPFVFGRGGEEAQALAAAGIPFGVVPGVTSAVAVPEQAGIPVTHRGVSRSFHVIAGHTAAGEPAEPYEALAALHGTLVFLMGLSRLEGIAAGLMAAGKPRGTPSAVVCGSGTTVRAPLCELAARARTAGAQAPAVILVGEAAALDLRCDPSCGPFQNGLQ
ncbi:MAG: siroheme synthase CysG [Gemmiger sp.]